MRFFGKDSATGIECGVNDDGNLFLGNERSGYNLPDTPENRENVFADFEQSTGKEIDIDALIDEIIEIYSPF